MTNGIVANLGELPLRVGLVGTGYAAKLRAEALQADPRTTLVAIAGHNPEKTHGFSQTYQAEPLDSWANLVQREDLDLVVIANVNRDHGAIVRVALQAGKHVVVEYPLALDVAEAEDLVSLARTQKKLLHVEHIELLGGVHQALKANLSQIGTPFHARYVTLNPQRPAPQKWTYQPDLFGFPLMGALSRLHRLTDLFGEVKSVSCQARFWHPETSSGSHYTACICTALLQFKQGLQAEVTYGKGETIWQSARLFQVQGQSGGLVFDGDQGSFINPEGTQAIAVGGRRGLFAKDTAMVLDHLLEGSALYVTPEASVYTLRVADAARRAAMTGQTIQL